LAINEDMLKEKAREFGKQEGVAEDFGNSPGWLHNVNTRYGMKSCVLYGEPGDANREGIQLARDNLRLVLERYTAEDTYNQDETSIFTTGMAWTSARGHGLQHVGIDLGRSMLMCGAPVLATQGDLRCETGMYVAI
jgi:hypothetical protein